MKRYLLKCRLLLIPSLLGVALFYVLPYMRVIYYSLIENQFSRKFVGLQNYMTVLQNEYFRLALKNSLLLIVLAVPVLVVTAFLLSLLLWKRKKKPPFPCGRPCLPACRMQGTSSYPCRNNWRCTNKPTLPKGNKWNRCWKKPLSFGQRPKSRKNPMMMSADHPHGPGGRADLDRRVAHVHDDELVGRPPRPAQTLHQLLQMGVAVLHEGEDGQAGHRRLHKSSR